ncbi:hypothetical protein GCM10022242_14460 [Nocardioides panacisoli]|uniref:Methyltransferase type 12 domain-containing protein n=1 Tax=Nocardioides panacisoli TaxID=627624 RepID=A0ABP7I9S9_9ACTN
MPRADDARSRRGSTRLGAAKSAVPAPPHYRLYRRLFGAEDMHSHYRWNALLPLVDLDARHTLEVGAGDGRMTFALVDAGLTGEVTAAEPDPVTSHQARETKALWGYENVEIMQERVGDLRALQGAALYDQVLAIDVLEHIEDDVEAMRQIASVIRPGGRLVVSVPTPRYPEVFGRKFHEQIGHVRDGYTLETLTALLTGAGFSVDHVRYYSGRRVAAAAKAFYGSHVPFVLGVLWAPLLRPWLMRSETTVDPEWAVSLAVTARPSNRA